jgi:hypothetical protein
MPRLVLGRQSNAAYFRSFCAVHDHKFAFLRKNAWLDFSHRRFNVLAFLKELANHAFARTERSAIRVTRVASTTTSLRYGTMP